MRFGITQTCAFMGAIIALEHGAELRPRNGHGNAAPLRSSDFTLGALASRQRGFFVFVDEGMLEARASEHVHHAEEDRVPGPNIRELGRRLSANSREGCGSSELGDRAPNARKPVFCGLFAQNAQPLLD